MAVELPRICVLGEGKAPIDHVVVDARLQVTIHRIIPHRDDAGVSLTDRRWHPRSDLGVKR
jgi:hypothetical protein